MSKRKTIVINLYGGPGTGKSTLAAELFYKLKMSGNSVELVREYVKDMVYQSLKINEYDQIHITGIQAKREYDLYNKVDYIITDSPLYLGPFYSMYYYGIEYIKDTVRGLIDHASKNNVVYKNYFLKRIKPYNSEGRFEDEKTAKIIDGEMFAYMSNLMDLHFLDVDEEKRCEFILSEVKNDS